MQADLPFLDLTAMGFSTRGPEMVAARDAHWCARTPYGLAVLRYRQAGQLLRDRRLRQGSYAWPAKHDLSGSFAEFWCRSIISTQGDAHAKLRRVAVHALLPEFVQSLIPGFETCARDLTECLMEGDACEFMADFSVPFAGQAIAHLLGLPYSDWREISKDASDLGLAMGVDCKSNEAQVNEACDRLMTLAQDLIDRANAGKDTESFVARLVTAGRTENLSNQDLLDLVVISIFGGVDTTRAQLGFAMTLFERHPDQWCALRADPSLARNAVEEIIRQRPTTTWATREAMEEIEFEGVTIKPGETVHILVHASATDPQITAQNSFDITAKRKSHFGFGGGAHHCLGQLVARTDMAVALRHLSARIERFSFQSDPSFLPDSGNTSPTHLPLQLQLG